MDTHPEAKPVVVISKCLGFERCRWNGDSINDDLVETIKPHLDCRPVCPEVEIGLGIPRDPIHIESRRGELVLLQPATDRDLTGDMLAFCHAFLSSLDVVDGFLLKSRSPSCGTGGVKVYPSGGKPGAAATGAGFFGGAVSSRFPHLPAETEDRLGNLRIREHYLTRLFAMSRFRTMAAEPCMHRLVDFHSRHEMLLMSYSWKGLQELNRLVADCDKRPLRELLPAYGSRFALALARPPRHASNLNVLMQAMDYFSKSLTFTEKACFLDLLEGYREGRIPLSSALEAVNTWIVRFGQEYLEQQTFFHPYPEELMGSRP